MWRCGPHALPTPLLQDGPTVLLIDDGELEARTHDYQHEESPARLGPLAARSPPGDRTSPPARAEAAPDAHDVDDGPRTLCGSGSGHVTPCLHRRRRPRRQLTGAGSNWRQDDPRGGLASPRVVARQPASCYPPPSTVPASACHAVGRITEPASRNEPSAETCASTR